MAEKKVYNAKEVALIFGTEPITGLVEDSCVTVERESDTVVDHIGADGDVSQTIKNDRRATVMFNLKQDSRGNDIFDTHINLMETTGKLSYAPLTIRDGATGSLVFAEEAWVSKPAGQSYGAEQGSREWTIRCSNLSISTKGL
ncbi:MAG: DUF3277 family protein [bacterium]|nr:DUF3277 family protein [bacterium]